MKDTDKPIKILWIDDEIDLLMPYILFLKEKGFGVVSCNNGDDALGRVEKEDFDLIFLDENMPGLSGLVTLSRLKLMRPNIPVVMISKNEEENIMDEAIGAKISDYLIKPVNPKQILLTIKKHMDTRRLVSQKVAIDYQAQFREIAGRINQAGTFGDWAEIYKHLVFWELELEESSETPMKEVLWMQKVEATNGFSRYIRQNYEQWFTVESALKPMLSPEIFPHRVFPLLDAGNKVFFLLIDNLRYDQWKAIEKDINAFLRTEKEELYCSILPTVTQYSRNSIFAGLMPLEINSLFPDIWMFDEDEGGKNMYEQELFTNQLKRRGKNYSFRYEKVSNMKAGKKLVESMKDLQKYDLNIIVYNFADLLSHARTDMEMIRELANSESAYRSLFTSWFRHSHLLDLIRLLSAENVKIILTTDHGSIRVSNALKVIGDSKTSTNLRYKTGKNLDYNPKEVFEIRNPGGIHLPKSNLTSRYIFAVGYDYMVYPKNFNYFVSYFKNTFQHGGISMEEMMIPFITLKS